MVCSGVRLRALATSPNCRSRSTSTVECGADRASPTARLAAMVVLPTPPLGETTLITCPRRDCVPAPRSVPSPSPAGARWRVTLMARSRAARISSSSDSVGTMSLTPARMAESPSSATRSLTRTTAIPGHSMSSREASARAASVPERSSITTISGISPPPSCWKSCAGLSGSGPGGSAGIGWPVAARNRSRRSTKSVASRMLFIGTRSPG